VAPIPGETKVWQYITLTRRIYLIDCPGVVPSSAQDTNTDTVLKGVVRVEALPVPSEHIPALLERVKPVYLARTYGIAVPESGKFESEALLDQLARQKGRLLKAGEPDRDGVAKILLSDWVRGRIPFFVPPPERPKELDSSMKDAGSSLKVSSINQKLGGLLQRNKFADDRPPPEEAAEELPVTGVEDRAAADASGERSSDDDPKGQVGEELQWADVFPEDDDPERSVQRNADFVNQSEEEDASDVKTKEARVSTNKRKATNFYTDRNVKNKNRNRTSSGSKKATVGKTRRR